ncbi:MAG: ATP-binding protein [Bacteroidia bacterium]
MAEEKSKNALSLPDSIDQSAYHVKTRILSSSLPFSEHAQEFTAKDEYDLEDLVAIEYSYAWEPQHLSHEWWQMNVHPDDFPELLRNLEEAISAGKRFLMHVHRFRISRDEFIMVMNRIGIAYRDEAEPLRITGVMIDITDQQRTENELAMMNYSLGRYAVELARSNEELAQFAYIASHDLQEPLRSISGFAGLLVERSSGQLDEKSHEFIRFIVDGTKRMQLLIRNLLEYSRITTQEQMLKEVNLDEVVDKVRFDLARILEEKGGTITTRNLPSVMGDENQLRQLFQNLIGNAVKFKKPDVPPVITITAEEQERYWQITVEDNGIGIDMNNGERIFQVFQRLHTREEYEGTGIGLAISKKIVEKHKGDIWMESRPGHGTKFHFSLIK